jgi:Tol biopolymer transport system component
VRAAVLVLAITVAALASAAAEARKVQAPTGALAFSLGYTRDIGTLRGGPRWISVSDLTGTRTKAITPARPKTASGADTNVSFSPDGRRIAFFRRGPRAGLYVAQADGSRIRRVAAGDAARLPPHGLPVWSPDGRDIAFALVGPTCPQTPKNAGVYIVSSGGGRLRRLRALTRSRGRWPNYVNIDAWSPDGRTLLYTELRLGNDCRSCCDSTVLTLQLQRGRPVVLASFAELYHDLDGVGWSADGTIIAYQECNGDACNVVMRRGNETWVVDPDYENVDEEPSLWGEIRWAPTGHRLTSLARFKSNRDNEAGDLELDVIDFDLKTVTPVGVIPADYSEAGLAWSSDAQKIVVAVDTPVVVYSVTLDGTPPTQIGRVIFPRGVTYERGSLFVS